MVPPHHDDVVPMLVIKRTAQGCRTCTARRRLYGIGPQDTGRARARRIPPTCSRTWPYSGVYARTPLLMAQEAMVSGPELAAYKSGPRGVKRIHKDSSILPGEVGQRFGTTVSPMGATAMTASFKCCTPKGIPIMVMKLARAAVT